MKYLKQYESSDEYKEGDYVLITEKFLIFLSDFFEDEYLGYVKILNIMERGFNKYVCQTTKNNTLHFHIDMIERKLNKKEIESFKLQLSANKYNL